MNQVALAMLQYEYLWLRRTAEAFGRVPPSLDVVFEEARRSYLTPSEVCRRYQERMLAEERAR